MKKTEIELIQAIKIHRDLKSFEKLVKLHQKNVRSLVFKFFQNTDELEDVSQEVFIKVYKSINSFKEKSLFSTWLYRLTINTCKDKLKSKQRINSKLVQLEDYHIDNITDNKDTVQKKDAIFLSDEQQNVLNSIKKLPKEQQIVLILHDVNEMSYEEISTICNCPLGTVKSRIFIARKKLRELLQSQ